MGAAGGPAGVWAWAARAAQSVAREGKRRAKEDMIRVGGDPARVGADAWRVAKAGETRKGARTQALRTGCGNG